MIRTLWLALALSFAVSGVRVAASDSAQEPCVGCSQTVDSIRADLTRLNQNLQRAENPTAESDSSPFFAWDAPAVPVTEPKPLFFQRLEAYDNWKASRARLENIERELQVLEGEIAADKAAGNPGVELDRMERLVRAQRLVVEELKFQLEQIYKKFQELDRQVDAHELRIDAVQGGLEKVSSDFKDAAGRMKAHAVASSGASYGSATDVEKLFTRDLDLSHIWVFPRTELRYEDATNTSTELTVSVEGSLFGIVKGTAKGGLVFDTRYSTEAYILTPGTQPLLSGTGAAMRDAAMYCAVSKTFTFRGFGSVGVSAGIDVKVIKMSTGATVEVGETISVNAKRYSPIIQFRQGETFQSKIAHCHKFTKEIRNTDLLSAEVSSMLKVVQIPESPCYKDYDCRKDVKLGALMPSVVSNCVTAPNRERAVCQHRYVDTEGATCSMPNERIYNFRYPCANGLKCDGKTRKCVAQKSGKQWLTENGIAEAKVVLLEANYKLTSPESANLCESQGLKGWKLPSQDQLKGTARWFREWARAELRRHNPRANAQNWFYAPQLFTGLIWSDGPAVYLLNNDSTARYNPADPEHTVLFSDPTTRKTVEEGIAICVRNVP